MNARIALGAAAALAIASQSFASDPQTIEIGTFANTSMVTTSYTGPFADFVMHEVIDGHNVVNINVVGILDSLGYDALWSITITDTGSNSYTTMSPGADIDLFVIEGISQATNYAYLGPNTVHQNESSAVLATRELALDSFSGAQDALNFTHVSLGPSGAITASWNQPLSLLDFVTPGTGGSGLGGGFGSGWTGYLPGGEIQPGEMPVLFISEHGSFESFHVSMVASAVPAPGALALLAIAGFVGTRRKRSA